MKKSKKDVMLKMFEAIAREEKLTMEIHRGVVTEFSKGDKSHYIYSYSFGLNPTSTSKICDNKRLASSMLNEKGIPAIEHITFATEDNENSFANNPAVLEYLDEHKELVCKYNDGGGGNDIFRITNRDDLENLPKEFWEDRKDITFSPFYNLKAEYRVIVLNEAIEVIFAKRRHFVTGDGTRTIEELMNEERIELECLDRKIDKNFIPQNEEKVLVNWQHNLAMGAVPVIITDEEIQEEVKEFSLKIAKTLNIKFASIDVARKSDGELILMEINAGVTLNRFAERNKQHYQIAKNIYKKSILSGLK